jgi:hypothetical protein
MDSGKFRYNTSTVAEMARYAGKLRAGAGMVGLARAQQVISRDLAQARQHRRYLSGIPCKPLDWRSWVPRIYSPDDWVWKRSGNRLKSAAKRGESIRAITQRRLLDPLNQLKTFKKIGGSKRLATTQTLR